MFAEQLRMSDGVAVQLKSDCLHTVKMDVTRQYRFLETPQIISHNQPFRTKPLPEGTRVFQCGSCGETFVDYSNVAPSQEKSNEEKEDDGATQR